MIIEERVYRSILRRKDEVFVRREFAALGSEAQVNRALRNLVGRGVIVKLGIGIYAKAKKSVLSGKAIPIKPISELAPLALQKLGVETSSGLLARTYNSGASTQIPAGNVLQVGRSRISRKLGFGAQTIAYEKH